MQENQFNSNGQGADNDLKSQEAVEPEEKPAEPLEELPDVNLSEELAKLQQEAKENYDLYVRARAEAENVRRRAAEDVSKARKYGIEKFAEAMLPVVDSLEKAIEASKNDTGHLKEGLEVTYRQMLSALESNGMKREDPVGKKFDPNTMQAIAVVEAPDVPPGHVAEVFQNGWKIADRVLRPAMVAVAK